MTNLNNELYIPYRKLIRQELNYYFHICIIEDKRNKRLKLNILSYKIANLYEYINIRIINIIHCQRVHYTESSTLEIFTAVGILLFRSSRFSFCCKNNFIRMEYDHLNVNKAIKKPFIKN